MAGVRYAAVLRIGKVEVSDRPTPAVAPDKNQTFHRVNLRRSNTESPQATRGRARHIATQSTIAFGPMRSYLSNNSTARFDLWSQGTQAQPMVLARPRRLSDNLHMDLAATRRLARPSFLE